MPRPAWTSTGSRRSSASANTGARSGWSSANCSARGWSLMPRAPRSSARSASRERRRRAGRAGRTANRRPSRRRGLLDHHVVRGRVAVGLVHREDERARVDPLERARRAARGCTCSRRGRSTRCACGRRAARGPAPPRAQPLEPRQHGRVGDHAAETTQSRAGSAYGSPFSRTSVSVPDDRHEQPLRVHVAGLDVDRLDLAGEHVLHLLRGACRGSRGPSPAARPPAGTPPRCSRPGRVKAWFSSWKRPSRRDRRHRLLDVVEAGPRLALRARSPCCANSGRRGSASAGAAAAACRRGGRVAVPRAARLLGRAARRGGCGVRLVAADHAQLLARGRALVAPASSAAWRATPAAFSALLGGLAGALGLALGGGGRLGEPARSLLDGAGLLARARGVAVGLGGGLARARSGDARRRSRRPRRARPAARRAPARSSTRATFASTSPAISALRWTAACTCVGGGLHALGVALYPCCCLLGALDAPLDGGGGRVGALDVLLDPCGDLVAAGDRRLGALGGLLGALGAGLLLGGGLHDPLDVGADAAPRPARRARPAPRRRSRRPRRGWRAPRRPTRPRRRGSHAPRRLPRSRVARDACVSTAASASSACAARAFTASAVARARS